MNIVLLASHAVAEYDDLRMLTDLGYDVFAPGGYEVPSRSGEGIRPALPDAPHHPEFVERLQETRGLMGEPGPYIDWGKAHLHEDIIEWADTIIVHHFPRVWIGEQWPRIKHKRVIWRTCGQSDPGLEQEMRPFHDAGMQIVRYSPAEKRYFESVGSFAGQDALIRFGKYPGDYGAWVGDDPVVGNVTQDLVQRGESCGLSFWLEATRGLPTKPAGKGSEALGGLGEMPYEAMLAYLTHIRAYLYTGTVPASYTLGLIEAMMTGVPVVSIGKEQWSGPGALFEGDEIAVGTTSAEDARLTLKGILQTEHLGWTSNANRELALRLFDIAKVGPQWREFLG